MRMEKVKVKMSYSVILSNQNFIPELFMDERWRNIPIEEKKEIIYSIFHIRNWKQLEPQYRIYFLQELENINAYMQKREANKLVLKDDMRDSIHTGPEGSGEIHINSKYVLEGIRYQMMIQEDGTNQIEEVVLDNENVELFCSICHEGEHKKHESGIKSNINTKEIKECYLNVLVNPNNKEERNVISYKEDPILYKMQPVEYYAFLNSENMTQETFTMLQIKFGIDEGFVKWTQHIKENNFEVLVEKWNEDNEIKESTGIEYTVTGLRKLIIRIMIEKIQKWYGIKEESSVYKLLNLDYEEYSSNIKEDWKSGNEIYDLIEKE